MLKFARKLIAPIICIAFIGVALLSNAAKIGGFIPKAFGTLTPVFAGFCIAFVANLVLGRLEKLWDRIFRKKKTSFRLRRGICLVLSEIIILGSLSLIFFVVIPHLAGAISSFVANLSVYAGNLRHYWEKISEFLARFSIVLPEIPQEQDKIIESITNFLSKNGNMLVDKAFNVMVKAGNALVSVIVAFTISVYVLLRKEQLGAQMRKLIHGIFSEESYRKIYDFFALCNDCFSNFVTGQLAEVVINTLLCLIGMLILRMPYALMISVLVGITALIPVFGAFIGSGAGALLILLVDPIKAIWFVIFIIAMQQVDGNIIYPRVVGKSVGLPSMLVFVAVTVGGNAFGILGMLFAVPVCTIVYTLLGRLVDSKEAKKKKSGEEPENGEKTEGGEEPESGETSEKCDAAEPHE